MIAIAGSNAYFFGVIAKSMTGIVIKSLNGAELARIRRQRKRSVQHRGTSKIIVKQPLTLTPRRVCRQKQRANNRKQTDSLTRAARAAATDCDCHEHLGIRRRNLIVIKEDWNSA